MKEKSTASVKENTVRKTVSLTNCKAIPPLLAPIVFFIPTSLALVADDAIERLIKLINAITRIMIANTTNIEIYDPLKLLKLKLSIARSAEPR